MKSSQHSSSKGGATESSPSTSSQEARRLALIAAGTIAGLAFFAATALLLPSVAERHRA